MPNELIIRNGYITSGSSVVNGTLAVNGEGLISGASLQLIASSASTSTPYFHVRNRIGVGGNVPAIYMDNTQSSTNHVLSIASGANTSILNGVSGIQLTTGSNTVRFSVADTTSQIAFTYPLSGSAIRGGGSGGNLSIGYNTTQTLTAGFQLNGRNVIFPSTIYYSTGAGTTLALQPHIKISNPTFSAANPTIITDAATVQIDGSPAQGGGMTLTNSWSLYVVSGNSRFNGNIISSNSISGASLTLSASSGADQFILTSSFTPSGSGDTAGNVGSLAWDNDYIYVKTFSGWGRTQLSYSF